MAVEHVSATQNSKLRAAIGISVVTSIVASLVGIVASVYALNSAFTLFASDSNQVKHYAKNLRKKKLKKARERGLLKPGSN